MSELDKAIDQIESHAALYREQRLRAEIERLRTAREECERQYQDKVAEIGRLLDDIERLRAEIAWLRAGRPVDLPVWIARHLKASPPVEPEHPPSSPPQADRPSTDPSAQVDTSHPQADPHQGP